jgi:hypothetical protein
MAIHDPDSAEMIARVFSEHLKLAGEISKAPVWLIDALGDIQQSMLHVLAQADAAAKRLHKIRPEHITPEDILVAPQALSGGVAVCLSERAIDMPHCYALYARPNPRCPAWDPEAPPLLESAKSTEPAYLVDLFLESPGDFSRTRLISIDAEAQLELQRQLVTLGVRHPFFSYVTLIKFASGESHAQ